MAFLGLSLSRNLKEANRQLAVGRDELKRFRVATIRFDVDQLEAMLRAKMAANVWLESDGDRVMVYADRPFTEAEKNAVVAWLPKPEKL